jgi:carbon starvation protein
LVWDLVVTLTASWQKIFSHDSAVGYWTQHAQYLAAKNAGKSAFGSAKNSHQLDEVIRNTFIQGTLSIIFALVVVIVFAAGVVVGLKTIRGDRRPPLSEDEPVPSKRFAPSGLISTAAEKELQRQWDGTPDKHVAPKSAAPS